MKIVWFSEIKWDYLRTRKQQIIRRKPADVELLFLEPFVRSGSNPYRLRDEGSVFCATIPFVKSAPHFAWRSVLDRGSARSIVDFIAGRRVRQVMARLGFDTPGAGFVVSNVYAANILPRFPRKFLLYDCNDDHSSFPGMRPWTKAYFERVARDADAVFASSQALLKKITEIRGDPGGCAYLGNGVDFGHFQGYAGSSPRRAPGAAPRLGYIGALAPWFDFDAVADLARARPRWEIVLVGPVLLGVESRVAQLTALPNVVHEPAVPYDRLPAIKSQFTLGLIPFRYNELTRGVNPNKMYEYLACGLPVVATRFSSEVEKFPGVVSPVEPGAELLRACDGLVEAVSDAAKAASISERARDAARQNDWDVIAAAFWSKVRGLMERS